MLNLQTLVGVRMNIVIYKTPSSFVYFLGRRVEERQGKQAEKWLERNF